MSLVSDPFISNTDTWLDFSHLVQNTYEFDNARDWKKKTHSHSLVALRCITQVLPCSHGDRKILQLISEVGFHQTWNLDGWNDHVIKPAHDAVLDYYKVLPNISFIKFLP